MAFYRSLSVSFAAASVGVGVTAKIGAGVGTRDTEEVQEKVPLLLVRAPGAALASSSLPVKGRFR